MEVHVLTDPIEFLDRTAVLLEDEARNNLILGLAHDMVRTPEVFEGATMFVVHNRDDVVGAALITPPHNLVVSDADGAAAVDSLVSAVLEHDIAIPGAVGTKPTIDQFIGIWGSATGDGAVVEMEQGVFSLERVKAVPSVEGSARPATGNDVDLIVRWAIAFMEEALPSDAFDPERFVALVQHL